LRWFSSFAIYLRERRNLKPVAWKEKIKIGPEFFEPLPPEELEGWA
jgi:hypothetical protein